MPIGRAEPYRKEVGLLRPGPRGFRRFAFGTNMPTVTCAGSIRSTRDGDTLSMRTTAVLLGFLNLTNMLMLSFCHDKTAWQVILISLKSS